MKRARHPIPKAIGMGIIVLLLFGICRPNTLKGELKGQLIGGMSGSLIGMGCGMLLASQQQHELQDGRKYLTYSVFGYMLGNPIGHQVYFRDQNPVPMLLSLSFGLAASLWLSKDEGRFLDGPVYWEITSSPVKGAAIVTGMVLFQPMVTTLTHYLFNRNPPQIGLTLRDDLTPEVRYTYSF